MSNYIMKDFKVIGFDPASGADISVSIGYRNDDKSDDLFSEFIDAIAKESKIELTDTTKELIKRYVVINGRQHGKSTLSRAIDDIRTKPELTYRRCDCLKCRMGKPDRCTTYSPKKRRGKK